MLLEFFYTYKCLLNGIFYYHIILLIIIISKKKMATEMKLEEILGIGEKIDDWKKVPREGEVWGSLLEGGGVTKETRYEGHFCDLRLVVSYEKRRYYSISGCAASY